MYSEEWTKLQNRSVTYFVFAVIAGTIEDITVKIHDTLLANVLP